MTLGHREFALELLEFVEGLLRHAVLLERESKADKICTSRIAVALHQTPESQAMSWQQIICFPGSYVALLLGWY